MSKAQQAFSLATTTNTTLDNKLKQLLRLLSDDCIICFPDKSYLVYHYDKNSYRNDKLRVECCQDDLPFFPVDVDLIDLTKEYD